MRSKTTLVVLALLTALLASMCVLEYSPGISRRAENKLLVLCAPSLRLPMTALARDFETATGTAVEIRFGGSQTLLADLQLDANADVFAPADESYLAIVQEKKLIGKGVPVARMKATVALRHGMTPPSWQELWSGNWRVGQAEPTTAAIGKLTREAFLRDGSWNKIQAHTTVFQPTVTDVFNAVKLGSLDAAIVWDVVVQGQTPTVDYAELKTVTARVSLAVATRSRQTERANSFLRFATDIQRGQKVFAEFGFNTGD